ncbi:MAG: TIGR01777 family oxidoreductase [Vicinamibacterales bacterium]
MKIVIAGGSGFLGGRLVDHFETRGFDVVVLTRSPEAVRSPLVRQVAWSPEASADASGDAPTPGSWAAALDGADAVVNLAGASLAGRRWTTAYKQELRRSRVTSTRALVNAVRAATTRPPVFVQGSAVGYYGTSREGPIDESCPPGDDFLGRMCVAWEAEALPLTALGVRLVILRTGIALARDGGALQKMAPAFRYFVGGPLGSGRQYLSWIHRDDWVAMVDWAIEHPDLAGPLNATAPEPATNAAFSKSLGRALHRPSWLPVPGFAVRLAVGELATEGLLRGQQVVPARARELGFVFRYPDLCAALTAIFARRV